MLLARAAGLPQKIYEEGEQSTKMLNPLLLKFLGAYELPEDLRRSDQLQARLRGRMEMAQKDLGLALEMAPDHGVALPFTGLATQLIANV